MLSFSPIGTGTMAHLVALNSVQSPVHPIILALTILLHTSFAIDTRSCYNVNNGIETGHRPCINPESKSISHCCSLNDTCLGDTLCLSQYGTLYVGSCTTKDWVGGQNGKGDCPKYCSDYRKKGTSADIALCDYDNGWNFCCGPLGGIEKCCSGSRFQIQNTTNQFAVERPWNLDSSQSTSSPPGATAPPATDSYCPEKPQPSKAAEIGIGVGLGIPLLMALGLLCWVEAKRRAAVAQLNPTISKQDAAHGPVQRYEGDYAMAYSQVPVSELPEGKTPTYEMGAERRVT